MHTNIFIVEDHPLMREMLIELLEEADDLHVSGMASSAEDALLQLERAVPEMLLIDLSLPGMSGFDLASTVRGQWPTMRSVMLSGHTEPGIARRALEAGASGFVVKGNPEEIVDAIRRVSRGETYVSDSVRQEA